MTTTQDDEDCPCDPCDGDARPVVRAVDLTSLRKMSLPVSPRGEDRRHGPEAEAGLSPAVVRVLTANHRRFLGFLERRVRRRDLAEELLQEAFTRGIARGARSAMTSRWWPGSDRLLRNVMIDHLRSQAAEDRGRAAFAREETAAPRGARSGAGRYGLHLRCKPGRHSQARLRGRHPAGRSRRGIAAELRDRRQHHPRQRHGPAVPRAAGVAGAGRAELRHLRHPRLLPVRVRSGGARSEIGRGRREQRRLPPRQPGGRSGRLGSRRCRRSSIRSPSGTSTRSGIARGWRCWEVGAGGPSVPRGLAARVGPEGRVLATDIELAWAGAAAGAPIEVRRHDVARDAPPDELFDLVHARLVLVHLPERERALRSMIGALRPGGWLLVEDADPALQPLSVLDPVSAEDAAGQQAARPGFARCSRSAGSTSGTGASCLGFFARAGSPTWRPTPISRSPCPPARRWSWRR